MRPTVGRIVHYTAEGKRDGEESSEVQAALITKVMEGLALKQKREQRVEDESFYSVSLRVFYDTGTFMRQSVPFTEAKAGTEEARGKWAWPERVS